MHTVRERERESTASERNPVERVKILKTVFGHIAYNLDRKIMDENSAEVGGKKLVSLFIKCVFWMMDCF